MTGLLAAGAALAVSAGVMTANDPPRCFVRINQPAASVRLNREVMPRDICYKSCQAKLVGAHREEGMVVGLAIYTGKRCR